MAMIALRLLTPCRYLCVLASVAAEVALEGSKIRVLLLQGSDIGLIAYVIDPSEVEGGLFSHLLLERVPRHLVVANLSPYDAAEGLGYLSHTLLVPGKIYLMLYGKKKSLPGALFIATLVFHKDMRNHNAPGLCADTLVQRDAPGERIPPRT